MIGHLIRRVRNHGGQDGGAVLVLAVLFVLIVGIVGGAVASLATTNLAVTSVLGGDQTQSYAAQSAVQVAIGSVRNMTSGSVPGYGGVTCPTTTVPIPAAGPAGPAEPITVWCAFGKLPLPYERQIVFAACPSATSCLAPGAFQPAPNKTAIVVATTTFYDLVNGCSSTSKESCSPAARVECTGSTQTPCLIPGTSVDVTGWDVTKSNS